MHLLEQVELRLQEFGRVDRENRKFLEKLLEGDQLAFQQAEVENPEARGLIIAMTIFAGERGLTDNACAQNEACALGVSSLRVAVLGFVAQQIQTLIAAGSSGFSTESTSYTKDKSIQIYPRFGSFIWRCL